MNALEAHPSSDLPLVAIAADPYNVVAALGYESQLHDLAFSTEWFIEPETLQEWAAIISDLNNGKGAPVHPYLASKKYKESVTQTFQDPTFQKARIEIIQEADVVLGINHYSSSNTEHILYPFVGDTLVIAAAFGKLALVSEVFPAIKRPEARGNYLYSVLSERGLQLNAQKIRRARGDMYRVKELYNESLLSKSTEGPR